LNIALDATYSLGRNLSGVGVYSRELLFGLAAAHPYMRFLYGYRAHRLLKSFGDRLPRNAHRVWLRSDGFWPHPAALFHGLNQRTDRVRCRRVVSTFHDLFVLTGDYSTYDFRVRFAGQARQAAERSDLIIAVSQFTADQVSDLLSIEPSKIRVVHHGVTPPRDIVIRGDDERENLILHVGAIQHRKNIMRLVEAFEQTPEDWKLVLAGSNGFGAEEILARIRRSPRRDSIELPGYVSNSELEEYYARARVFAFPSLDEGFGMPVLDAMIRGVPVLTSNRSGTKEVAGNAALLIDPEDQDSVSGGLVRIVRNATLRYQLRAAGLARATGFSWAGTAAETWRVYEELL
jgi:glycosyltransferase involved in cell wall biosynthesis